MRDNNTDMEGLSHRHGMTLCLTWTKHMHEITSSVMLKELVPEMTLSVQMKECVSDNIILPLKEYVCEVTAL